MFGFLLDIMFPGHSHGGVCDHTFEEGKEEDHAHGPGHEHTHDDEEAVPMKNAINGDKHASTGDVDIELEKVEKEKKTFGVVLPKHNFCDFKPINPVAWNLCLGDACHNITDGVMIGAAFMSCNARMGWVICGVSLAHELPGEIGDFFLLLKAGMSLPQALFWNFFSGLTAVMGLVLVFASDIASQTLGLLLLVGAGVFIYISFANLVPEILHAQGKDKWIQVLFFAIGIITINLSVLAHKHCDAAAGTAMASLHYHAPGEEHAH